MYKKSMKNKHNIQESIYIHLTGLVKVNQSEYGCSPEIFYQIIIRY